MPVFKTQFGREIPFFEGYRDMHGKSRLLSKGAANKKVINGPVSPMHFKAFFKDVTEWALMIDFLQECGLPLKYGSALDIGGAEGIVSRLLKSSGRVERAECIEIEDFREKLDDQCYSRHIRTLRGILLRACFSKNIRRALIGDGEARIGKTTVSGKARYFGYHPDSRSALWQKPKKHDGRLDRYIVGDYYEETGSYDLITSILSVQAFEISSFFKKSFDLLDKGGTLFVMASNWWWPVNTGQIIGHFPYASQRLTREDLERYLRDHHPEEADIGLSRNDRNHVNGTHPVLEDYCEAARREGFEVAGAKRLMPETNRDVKTPFPPTRLMHEWPDLLEDVLADIHCFEPSVRMSDLRTAYVAMAFSKPRVA